MNLADVKRKTIKLIDEWSTNNSLTSAAQNGDYTMRMNDLADIAQKEISTVKKINSSFTVTQNPVPNQLGVYAFDLIQHLNTDNVQSVAVGAQSYYFEVDRPCTVYLEEQIASVWTILTTIVVPALTSTFTAYKGNLTLTSVLNSVRIRFSGSYPYNIRNRALYAYLFPTDNDVQVFRPWVKYDLPADYMALNKVVNETDVRQYTNLTDYKAEGRRTLLFNYFMNGSFRIEYFKYPADITPTSDDTATIFELDTEACELIPYYIAGHLILSEDVTRSVTLLNMYSTKLANLSSSDNNNSNMTSNQMGW
jgi:hypothetical protein